MVDIRPAATLGGKANGQERGPFTYSCDNTIMAL